jgi:4-alpha-glucanotransferase
MNAQLASSAGDASNEVIGEALRLLGKQNLVLAIHDPSYPSTPTEDIGRGSPYSQGGLEFIRFARHLGFNGVQFGPQGQTSRINQSPYDGTIFSKNLLSIALAPLAFEPRWARLLSRPTVHTLVERRPEGDSHRVQYRYVFEAQRAGLREAASNFFVRRASGDFSVKHLAAEFDDFRERHRSWLERDSIFEALLIEHRGADWHGWGTEENARLDQRLFCPKAGEELACEHRKLELHGHYREEIDYYQFCQYVVHRQHQELRERLRGQGIKLYGDLQIGLSPQDTWALQSLFLASYRLGAPPSRTNPQGQPWGLAVFDPSKYADGEQPGPALRLVMARLDKVLAEFDGVRLDHPHGLVCPWVYRADDADPLHAVQSGARLFDSPNLTDHPELAAHAIVRAEQLCQDAALPRYADGWVQSLDEEQVARYSAMLDVIVGSAHAHGRDSSDVVCEVLSTQPYPLARVMERHGFGRFRVTQKAKLNDPADVYRSENAQPADWIMVGNHDTPPIWLLANEWHGTPAGAEQAAYLARRLRPDGDHEALEHELLANPNSLVAAKFADIFASRAKNVMVFFADLLGFKEVYNAPGTVNEENWTLRAPGTYSADYYEKRARGEALHLPRVLAMAMRARGVLFARRHAEIIARLETL